MATQPPARPAAATRTTAVEVATTSADPLHATIRVTGSVSRSAVPLLSAVLNVHLRAERRYLYVDLGSAEVGMAAVRCLAALADAADAAGCALVIADAQPGVADAIEPVRRTPVRG